MSDLRIRLIYHRLPSRISAHRQEIWKKAHLTQDINNKSCPKAAFIVIESYPIWNPTKHVLSADHRQGQHCGLHYSSQDWYWLPLPGMENGVVSYYRSH